MKKLLLILLAFATCFSSFAITPPSAPRAADVQVPLPGATQTVSLTQFLTLSPKEYKATTGKKLNLRSRIELRYGQHLMRQAVHQDGTIDVARVQQYANDGGFHFHVGGFLLGFFLGLIGVLITLFFHDDNKKARTGSALIGAALVLALALILAQTAGN